MRDLPIHERELKLGDIEVIEGTGGKRRELDFGKHHAFGQLIWEMDPQSGHDNACHLAECAERIVTCVNVMRGTEFPMNFMDQAQRNAMELQAMTAERDRLIGFLKTLQPYIDSKRQPGEMWPSVCVDEALLPYKEIF